MSPSGVIAVITIMLALIVQGTLGAAFTPGHGLAKPWSQVTGIAIFQVAVFFVLIFRFYLGALRFGQTEPRKVDFFVRSFNFIFAFAVFSVFYVTALTVTHPDFYLKIIILHAIDALWFGALWFWSQTRFVDEARLEVGEFRIEPVRHIMGFYAVISGITTVVGWFFCFGPATTIVGSFVAGDRAAVACRWIFLVALLGVSAFDFWTLRYYYFYFGEWKREDRKKGSQDGEFNGIH